MGPAAKRPGPASGEHSWPAPDRVERLLAGGPAERGSAAQARLAGLVTALTAPAALHPVREEAAVAAFRAAWVRRAVPGRRRHRKPARGLRVLVGGVVAVCAFGVLTVGWGVGALPGPFQRDRVHARPPAVTAEGADATSGPDHGGAPVPDGTATSRTQRSSPPPARPATPAPSRPAAGPHALCGRYANALRQGKRPGALITGPLAKAAGGRARIAGYCLRLLATGRTHPPDAGTWQPPLGCPPPVPRSAGPCPELPRVRLPSVPSAPAPSFPVGTGLPPVLPNPPKTTGRSD